MKKSLIILLMICFSINASAQNAKLFKDELTTDTSAWPLLLQKVAEAKNKVEILPITKDKNKEALYQTQVTTHSYMGAVIYFTGGILIDNGWIRLLGSGSAKMNRSLPEWNKGKSFKEFGEVPPFLLIADDAIGGFFAINGGALGNDKGKIYYLSPGSLNWESLDLGYTDFLDFCLNADLEKFYKQFRWSTWKRDIIILKRRRGI